LKSNITLSENFIRRLNNEKRGKFMKIENSKNTRATLQHPCWKRREEIKNIQRLAMEKVESAWLRKGNNELQERRASITSKATAI
jgi:hypothetical protein